MNESNTPASFFNRCCEVDFYALNAEVFAKVKLITSNVPLESAGT